MNSLSILIPISIVLITIAIVILRWAIRNGQYDDLDKPGHSILFDDDKSMIPEDKNRIPEGKDKIPENKEKISMDKKELL
jgi:cbb3-type cytochrome oxidase maturation protein